MARPKTLTSNFDVLAGESKNILEGIQGRFLKGIAIVQVSLNRGATGLNTEVTIGSEQVLPSGPVTVNATADELPSIRDDTIITTVGGDGDEVIVKAQNTTGATVQSRAIVRITEFDDNELILFATQKGLIQTGV